MNPPPRDRPATGYFLLPFSRLFKGNSLYLQNERRKKNIMRKTTYQEPEVRTLLVSTENMVCSSGDLQIDPETNPWETLSLNAPYKF